MPIAYTRWGWPTVSSAVTSGGSPAVPVPTSPVPAPEAPNLGEQVLRALGLDPRNIETRALVLLCERYRLDPLANHAAVIMTKSGPRPYITRDGMLEVAHRSGVFDGITVDEERRSSDGHGFTAYVSVWRKDMSHPFRYGAQCKDDEPQARQGNGPEMALARAERRALRRAFNIPAYGDDPDTGDAHADAVDIPAEPELEREQYTRGETESELEPEQLGDVSPAELRRRQIVADRERLTPKGER